MKYLELFEAFESDALSSVFKYLKKSSIDSKSISEFRAVLLKMQDSLDIPLSSISNNHIKYLKAKEAIKVRNIEPVESDSGIYCFKFWFSLEKGYMGFTSTGNFIDSPSERNTQFNDEEIDYIINRLGIRTGLIKPVTDYNTLKHGELVLGIFSDINYSLRELDLAKIWKENVRLYAIQSVSDGNTPDDMAWLNWQESGRFTMSWGLGRLTYPASDHYKLHHYKPSDTPLSYDISYHRDDNNPLNYNVPVSSGFKSQGGWKLVDWSIDNKQKLLDSDFAVVIMYDDILKSLIKSGSVIRAERGESRAGALKLMKDADIKKANLNRYIQSLSENFDSLQKVNNVILRSLCGDFGFISLYNEPIKMMRTVSDIENYLYEAMSDEDMRDYYLSKASDFYKKLISNSIEISIKYQESLRIIEKYYSKPYGDDLKLFFEIVMRIGKKIRNHVKDNNIESLDDISFYRIKLQSIQKLLHESRFKFDLMNDILYLFREPESLESFLVNNEQCFDSEDIKKASKQSYDIKTILKASKQSYDIKTILKIERFIDSIIK